MKRSFRKVLIISAVLLLFCSNAFADDETPATMTAMINMRLKFYRGEGGSPAFISAETDPSARDSGVLFEWTVPECASDVTDTSGGLGHSISFYLASPGRYKLSLRKTDTQGNVLAADSVDFTVDNIAPTLGIRKIKDLELLLINSAADAGANGTGGADSAAGAGANGTAGAGDADAARLTEELLNKGISADIYPVSLDTEASGGVFSLEGRFSGTYSRDLDSNFFYNSAFSCDDKYIFRIVPTIVSKYPSPPFNVYRYEIDDLSASPTVFPIDSTYLSKWYGPTKCSLGSDLQQQYLYLSIGGNSVAVDKESGRIFGPFNDFIFGQTNIIAGGSIYSLLDDGVYKIDLNELSVSKILDCRCIQNCVCGDQSARLFHGGAIFTAKTGNVIYRYKIDLRTGELSREPICDNTETAIPDSCTDHLLAITPTGKIYINTKISNEISIVRGWDRELNELFSPMQIPFCSKYGDLSGIYPVSNSANEVNYIYTANAGGNDSAAEVRLLGLYNGYDELIPNSTKTYFTRNVMAVELNDGTVFIGLGGDATTSKLTTYLSKFIFLTKENSEGVSLSFDPYLEYGYRFNDTIITARASGTSASCYVYKLSEGYPDNLARISLATLPWKAEYVLATQSTDADFIASYCGGADEILQSYIPPHYKIGETVRLSDFHIAASDFENDLPFTEECSISLPDSFDEPGEYFFDYRVTDCTGNNDFNYSSKKIRLSFFVDPDEEHADGNEDENSGSGSGGNASGNDSEDGSNENAPRNIFQGAQFTYRLHRLY